MLNTYKYQTSFWKENQELLALKVYKEFYNNDKSKGKEESSRVMWAIYFVYDYESRYAGLPFITRKELIEKEFLEEENFFTNNEENLSFLIKTFLFLQKDSERRYLDTWQEVVEKRRIFLEAAANIADSAKDWESLDKMLINSKQILAQKDDILQRINKEGKGKIKGDIQIGLLAQGIIQPVLGSAIPEFIPENEVNEQPEEPVLVKRGRKKGVR